MGGRPGLGYRPSHAEHGNVQYYCTQDPLPTLLLLLLLLLFLLLLLLL